MIKKFISTFSIAIMVALIFGCSDRGTNINEPVYDIRRANQAILDHTHLLPDELALSMFTSIRGNPSIFYAVYVPPPRDVLNPAEPFPVLFLLAPFGENQLYYYSRGLVEVADKMIAEGEIEPMIIVCINGALGYGGTFYGNSWGGGKYAKAIGDIEGEGDIGTLLDYVNDIYGVLTNPGARAISGFGVGGYGAFRIAVEYSENFSSVSAVSAPLDFDGADGNSGFVSFFNQIIGDRKTYLNEIDYSVFKPIPTAPVRPGHLQSFTPIDTSLDTLKTMSLLLSNQSSGLDTIVAAIYDSFPTDSTAVPSFIDTVVVNASSGGQWVNFDFDTVAITHGTPLYLSVSSLDSSSATTWHYSKRNRYGYGNAWFSRGDHSFERYAQGDFIFDFGENIPYLSIDQYKAIDSTDHMSLPILMAAATNFSPYIDYDYMTYPGSPGHPATANDTFFFADTSTLIKAGQGVQFLMPFDTAGNTHDTVWNMWLANNIDSLLDIYPSALDSMFIKLFIASDEGYGFNQQTRSFANYLDNYLTGRGFNRNIDLLVFDGYEDYPATVDKFVYDILPEILKFHSYFFEIP